MGPILTDEFRFLVPVRLSPEEYALREQNLIRETHPKESIIFFTHNDTLIDGYDDYDICLKHNLLHTIVEKQFEDKDAAKVHVLDHHLSIPTYTAFAKIEMAIKRADILKLKEQAKQRMIEASHPKKTKDDAFVNSQKQLAKKTPDDGSDPINVTKQIAKETNLGEQIVSRGIQLLKNAPEAIKEKLRRNETTINQEYGEHKKRQKEAEKLKSGKNEISQELESANKNANSQKIMENFLEQMESFLGRLPKLNCEHLNSSLEKMQDGCALIEKEIEKRKLNPEQPNPPAPATTPDSPPTQLQETVQPTTASPEPASMTTSETASHDIAQAQDIISGLKGEWSQSDGAWERKKTTESPDTPAENTEKTAENNNSETASSIEQVKEPEQPFKEQEKERAEPVEPLEPIKAEEPEKYTKIHAGSRIYVTHCAKTKNDSLKDTDEGIFPDELYKSKRTQGFMNKCKQEEVNWAIFSDYCGVWFSDEKGKYYSSKVGNPNNVNEEKFKELVKDFDEKLKNYDEIWFYYHPGRFHPIYKRLLQETTLKDRVKLFTHIDEIV